MKAVYGSFEDALNSQTYTLKIQAFMEILTEVEQWAGNNTSLHFILDLTGDYPNAYLSDTTPEAPALETATKPYWWVIQLRGAGRWYVPQNNIANLMVLAREIIAAPEHPFIILKFYNKGWIFAYCDDTYYQRFLELNPE